MYLKLLIAVSAPLLLGTLALAAWLRQRLAHFGPAERWALALACGLWLLTLIMFALPLLNLPVSLPSILLSSGLLLAALIPFGKNYLNYFRPKIPARPKNILIYVLIGLISVKVLFVFWSALIQPVIGPDLLVCYALSAKHTFMFQAPLYLANEPPLPFLTAGWIPIALGTYNDALMRLFFPLLFISLLTIFYSALRRCFSTGYCLLFTFLLSALPLLLFHAGSAYADFPAAFYYSAATIYLFQFFKEYRSNRERSLSFLLVSAALIGMTIWVKKSGLYYLGINYAVWALFLAFNRRQIKLRPVLEPVLISLVVALPWLAYNGLSILTSSLAEAAPSLTSAAAAPVLLVRDMSWVVVIAMVRNMFLEGNWQLLWALFFCLLILYPKRAWRRPDLYLTIIILLQLAALFVLYRFTGAFPNVANNTQLNRLMLHFAPVTLYFCAEIAAARRSPDQAAAGGPEQPR